jgi:hypothetical protein
MLIYIEKAMYKYISVLFLLTVWLGYLYVIINCGSIDNLDFLLNSINMDLHEQNLEKIESRQHLVEKVGLFVLVVKIFLFYRYLVSY